MKGDEFMLKINDIDTELIKEAAKPAKKRKSAFKWIAAAACLAVAFTAVFGAVKSGMFTGTLSYTSGGEKLDFSKEKSLLPEPSYDFEAINADDRPLTDDECLSLFGEGAGNFLGCFSREDGKLFWSEGELDGSKFIAAKKGKMLNDSTVTGAESEQSFGGRNVAAGYFVTDANSRGERTVIFYVSFELDENEYYIERAGFLADKGTVGEKITAQIASIINNGGFDLDSVVY